MRMHWAVSPLILLFIWPVYVLWIMVWLVIAAILLVATIIEFVVVTLTHWIATGTTRSRGGW